MFNRTNETGQTGQCSETVSDVLFVLFVLLVVAEDCRFFSGLGQVAVLNWSDPRRISAFGL